MAANGIVRGPHEEFMYDPERASAGALKDDMTIAPGKSSSEECEPWSDEALELQQKLLFLQKESKRSLKPRPKLAFIYSNLKSLRLVERDIHEIDQHLARMKKLEILELTANKIERLQNLPSSLKVLRATGNRYIHSSPLSLPLPSP